MILFFEVLTLRTIIIPTLNEELNIGRLISGIYSSLDEKVSVIVVDDASIDKTQDVVRDLGKKHPGVKLIVRTNEKGLSSAVRRGASNVEDGYVAVMDADLSHHPRYLPLLFEKLDEGYDLAIGSRYVPGGATKGWPIKRILVSKFATLLARILLSVKVKDPMTGYVACKSPSLLKKGIEHADYKFLLEMIVKNRHLRVAEVPIVFRDRTKGKSKLAGGTIFLFLALVIRLFLRRK